jgi:hypothetical protein
MFLVARDGLLAKRVAYTWSRDGECCALGGGVNARTLTKDEELRSGEAFAAGCITCAYIPKTSHARCL